MRRVRGSAAGETPNQIGIDGAKRQLARVRRRARERHVFEQPRQLGTREIRVEHEAGQLAHASLVASSLQLCAARSRAPILPDDRALDRLAAVAVPKQRRFTLIGQADRGDLAARRALLPGGRQKPR